MSASTTSVQQVHQGQLDHQEILERISDLALGLDLPDPARYRRCFADLVEIRNPTFAVDGRARECSGDEWAGSVSRTQGALTAGLHSLTSPSVELRGERATAIVMQQALFVDPAGSYRVGGPLRLGFIRTGGGWRIRQLQFDVRWSDGDPGVYARARESLR